MIRVKDFRTRKLDGEQNELNPVRKERIKIKDFNRPEYIFRNKINLEKSRKIF